jgi:hypothetical protein
MRLMITSRTQSTYELCLQHTALQQLELQLSRMHAVTYTTNAHCSAAKHGSAHKQRRLNCMSTLNRITAQTSDEYGCMRHVCLQPHL